MVFHGFPMVFPWFSHGFPVSRIDIGWHEDVQVRQQIQSHEETRGTGEGLVKLPSGYD